MHAVMRLQVDENLIAMIIGFGSAAAGAIGVYIRERWKASTDPKVAQIEADSSTSIAALPVLLERVSHLEKHNREQDKAINRLTIENAHLGAKLHVAEQQVQLLKDQNTALRAQNEELREENRQLREISEPAFE